MNTLLINKCLDEVIRELSLSEEHIKTLHGIVTYKFSRQSMITRNCRVDYVTKHMFVVNGMMTDVVESKTGFFWKNISRPTMKTILKEIVKSQIK